MSLENKKNNEKYQDQEWGSQQLKKINIFKRLNDEELKKTYKLGSIKEVLSKSHVVVEGEPSRGLYIVLEGTLSVHKTDLEKQSLIRLAYLEAGSVFGELSLIDDAPRSATVEAEDHCMLFSLSEDLFKSFLEKEGDNLKSRFYQACAEEISERFRKQNIDYILSQTLLWKYALRKNKKNEKNENEIKEDPKKV